MTRPLRVISLVPSATESLLSWGVEPVACTRFCEQPHLQTVGGTKDPDLDAIVELGPDLVVMCEEENLKDHHDQLVGRGVATFTLRIDGLADVAPHLAAMANAVGVEPDEAEIENLAVVGDDAEPWLKAFVPIWRKPWMTLNGGTYGSSLLAHLGVINVFADHPTRYPEVTEEEIRARAPDMVLAPTEPYPFAPRHLAELTTLAPAHLVEGQDLFWWGTRTPAAITRLRATLAPLRATLAPLRSAPRSR